MTEQTNNSPDPAEAFEAVRRELGLLHIAIAGLIAEREKIPDYSQTLAQMRDLLGKTSERLRAIEQSRAISLSPVDLAKEIGAAAQMVRIEDRHMLDKARSALDQSVGRVDGIVKRGQAADWQIHRERWHAVLGFVVGILLCLALQAL